MNRTKKPQSLHEWLNATGTSQTMFLRMFLNHTGIAMSKGQLSDILRGSRRCSLERALALSEITGVPVEKLVEWPTARSRRILSAPIQDEVAR